MFSTRADCVDFLKQQVFENRGHGLEVSPDIAPVLAPSQGFEVEYADARSTEALKARAEAKGRSVSAVPFIHHRLSAGKTLAECVGQRRYDFVFSSHLVERIPDIIGHFYQVAEVLRPGGRYAFLVPDKNLCFDVLKPETSLGELIEAHLEKRSLAPIRALIDEYYYGMLRNSKGGWSIYEDSPMAQQYNKRWELIAGLIKNRDQLAHWQGHTWMFTPASFQSLYLALGFCGLAPMRLENVIPVERMEFLAVLSAP